MKARRCDRRIATILIAAGMLAGLGWAPDVIAADGPVPAGDDAGQFVTTHVLARTRPGVAPALTADGRPSFGAAVPAGPARRGARQPADRDVAAVLEAFGTRSIAPALGFVPKNRALAAQLGLDRTWRVELGAPADVHALCARLQAFDDVFELVEPDGVGGTAATVPDDTDFELLQYALRNTGQVIGGQAGVPGADVRATEAWDLATGAASTRLFVIDTGISPHMDLAGRVSVGWNVVHNNTDTTSSSCVWHGTHVAGSAGANGNNARNIAGMDWAAEIVPVRILDGCTGPTSELAEGIIWAADNGADVMSMSLQYQGTEGLLSAVQYARGLGVILVAAAGNNGFTGGVTFPARYPETIAVAATTNQDTRWTGSNQGPELTIAAPGHNIHSLNGTIGSAMFSGTSMATPHVSGLVCLMLDLDSDITHDEVQEILIATAVDLGAPGFDTSFGHGRIDAYAALREVMRRQGDLDGNGMTDTVDLLALLATWGPCPAPPDDCPTDLDGDGLTGTPDLLILLANWG